MSANSISFTSHKCTELLTSEQAAAYLGVSSGTLEVWRCTKRYHLPFIKVGRLVRYRKSDLDSFLDRRTIGERE